MSLLYAALLQVRRWLYQAGGLKARRVECAIIVVGNAIVGGAGKTPTTMGIVQHLQSKGLVVGVVSRGFGRTDSAVCPVTPGSDATLVGDEPLLIARATQAPVFVASDRHAAACALLAAYPTTQVIVCDDGLQHYPLYRDIEVCVFDDRGTGNGWLLPSGPLREPWPRTPLASVGQRDDRLLVLHTGGTAAFAGFRAQRALAEQALASDGQGIALDTLQPPLLALAGIARPENFFSALRALGLHLDKALALPDHFDFSTLDTAQLRGHQVLCTEKDAVKLWKVWPKALAVPLVQTLEPAFLDALDHMLGAVLAAKLSSPHGHQTA
jgi:tetraacyldisaccharide 4'-kinase